MTARKGSKTFPFRPDYAVRPGVTIREVLLERGLTQVEVARQWGVSPSVVSDLIFGRYAITANVALRLEGTTGVTAAFWMGLQSNFDLAVARGAKVVE